MLINEKISDIFYNVTGFFVFQEKKLDYMLFIEKMMNHCGNITIK